MADCLDCGALQGFLRQELADFREALEDHFSEHFHRQELLLNQHALHREAAAPGAVAKEQSLAASQHERPSRKPPEDSGSTASIEEVGERNEDYEAGDVVRELPSLSAVYQEDIPLYRNEARTTTFSPSVRSLNCDPETQIPKEAPRAFHPIETRLAGDEAFVWRRMVSLRLGEMRKDTGEPVWKAIGRWVDWWFQLNEPIRTGRIPRFVNSKTFSFMSFTVLLLNSVFTVINTDWEARNEAHDVSPGTTLLNAGFVFFYTIEVFLKILAHRVYFFCNEDMVWNIFDLGLVAMAILDLGWDGASDDGTMGTADSVTLRTARVLRLAKILRVVRLVHFFAQLRLILNSLVGSFVSLFWSIIMLMLMFFVFALVFVQRATTVLISGNLSPAERLQVKQHMGSIEDAMLMLFQATTGGSDWTEFYDSVILTGPFASVLFLFFIAFSSFAVMNILTGIFVESAMKLAQPDRETVVVQQRRLELAEAEQLRQLLRRLDVDGRGFVSQEQFMEELRDERFRTKLALMGLDIKSAELFFDIITSGIETNHKDVPIEMLVAGAMRLKGTASSLDLHTMSLGTKILHDNQAGKWALPKN